KVVAVLRMEDADERTVGGKASAVAVLIPDARHVVVPEELPRSSLRADEVDGEPVASSDTDRDDALGHREPGRPAVGNLRHQRFRRTALEGRPHPVPELVPGLVEE